MTSGRRISHAASPPGPETKPPAPSTTFGRRRRITCRLCQIASDSLNGAASQVANPLPRRPLTLIHSTSMCCGGTSFASSPRCVPSHTGS
jgi:hypothetical protein